MKLWKASILFCLISCVALLTACSSNQKPTDDTAPQPMPGATAETADASANRGKKIYSQYCSTCHQAKGEGIESVYPPLVGSEFLKDKQKTINAVSNGLQGKLVVKGKEYNSIMPPVPGNFSNADVAAAINYVVVTFGDGSWTVTADEVAKIRK